MRLELTNNLTKITKILDNIEDKNSSGLFYSFDISLDGTYTDGEYTYRLIDEEKVVATGLLQIGDYERDMNINTEYENNKKDIIVYNG
jgi:hypothetical protein